MTAVQGLAIHEVCFTEIESFLSVLSRALLLSLLLFSVPLGPPPEVSSSWLQPWFCMAVCVCVCVCVCAQSCSHAQLLPALWIVAHQAPPSMGLSQQEYWSGLLVPPPGNLPGPGIEPVHLVSLHWQTDSLPLHHLGSPRGWLPVWLTSSSCHCSLGVSLSASQSQHQTLSD